MVLQIDIDLVNFTGALMTRMNGNGPATVNNDVEAEWSATSPDGAGDLAVTFAYTVPGGNRAFNFIARVWSDGRTAHDGVNPTGYNSILTLADRGESGNVHLWDFEVVCQDDD
ncbi:MAG TPA: hypothetical protein VFQ45_06525 [Longimicrobium sp.]|nr:hypothetical protein [Longimicrobium sp.]